MNNHNNVNNVSSLSENNNVTMLNNVEQKHRRAERVAARIVDKLSNPDSHDFYIKVAYKLSESTIEQLIEIAYKKRFKCKWFTWASNLIIEGKASLINGRIVMADQMKKG